MLYIYVKDIIFKENAICLKETLNNKGYFSMLTDRIEYDDDFFYIFFGVHNIIEKMPKKYIVYQLEQSNVGYYDNNIFLDNNHKIFNKKYIEILQNAYEVWDYSKENLFFFEQLNTKLDNKIKCLYVPLCYSPYLTTNYKEMNKDIDILFFGSKNDRRYNIINNLKKKGLIVEEYYNNLYEEDRLNKILRSKIILNIHIDENSLLETHLINYLLSNKSFVRSENSRDTFEDIDYNKSLIFCNCNNIVDKCLEWLNNDERDKIALNGHNLFKKTNFLNFIEPSIKSLSIYFNRKLNEKQMKQKKIHYHTKSNIQDADTYIENDNIFLKLDSIIDDDLPCVSIITPTGNRRKFFSLAIKNFESFIYPKNKVEWLILDDGEEEIEDILPKDSRINYVKLNTNKRLSIGNKRNTSIKLAKYDYIVFMDDDDYYFPESIMVRIKIMLKYNKQCVGCSSIGNYNLINNQSTLSSDGDKYLTEGSLAFKRKFWEDRQFNNEDFISEFKYFQSHRQNEMINIPFQFVIISLTHNNNTTGTTRNHNNFSEWLNNNKENYSDLFGFFDIETQIFMNDLRKSLGIQNRQELFC